MKKVIITVLFLLCSLEMISADIIPPLSHYVQRTVTVANVNEFSKFTLVAYVTGPMIQGYEASIIKENMPITKGYKFNKLQVFAFDTAYLEALGGLKAIDLSKVVAVMAPVDFMDPQGPIVEDTNPVKAEFVVYRIHSVDNQQRVVLYIAEWRLQFSDGTPDKVEHFEYTP